MKKVIIVSIIACLSVSSIFAWVEKPQRHQDLEVVNDITRESRVEGNMRIETVTGIPRAIYSADFSVTASSPETMARQYLVENAELLQHTSASSQIKFLGSVETPGGHRVQFMQYKGGYPVYGASIKVSINRSHEVVFVTNGYQRLSQVNLNMGIPQSDALAIAQSYLKMVEPASYEQIETVVYQMDLTQAVLAHRVVLVPRNGLIGDWEILINASSGAILRAEDKACYDDAVRETASAWVFDPDPITAAKTLYGEPNFDDNYDNNNDSLTHYLREVILDDIQYADGMYRLSGPYASIIDSEGPFTGLYEQDSSNFHYTRDQLSFEAVNAYYHLNHSMAYLNDSLGFDVMPFQYEGGVQFDPHGLDGDQNAHFMPSTGWLAFGSPGYYVDAAEDHAIVLHELGHGIHSWITNGGISQVDGLSEGLSDYWAQSYTRDLGIFDPTDEQYDYFGQWGLQPFFSPTLRVTNFPNHYPEGLGGEVHYDGQLWASSLMSIYDLIGRNVTDIIVWEGISMTDGYSNQVDAAFAVIQADRDRFNSEHLEQIVPVFLDRGYIAGPVTAKFEADQTAGPGPLTVQFQDMSLGYPDGIISWQWDFDGDGSIDSDLQNPTHTYVTPGVYSVTLTASNGTYSDAMVIPAYISINSGVLVFEGFENGPDQSGTFFYEQLQAMHVETTYSNRLWTSLIGYDAVFLSLGNLGNIDYRTILSDLELSTILDYTSNGGHIYIEGGSLMALAGLFEFAQTDSLWNLFGIDSSVFFEGDEIISDLQGQPNSIMSGFSFTNSSQAYNWYPDQLYVSSNGAPALVESDFGILGIQNEGDLGQKTFYFTHSLSNLVDHGEVSTRENVLLNVIDFFDISILVANFSASSYSGHAPLEVQFSDATASNPEAVSWAWDFDGDGVTDSQEQSPSWTFTEPGEYPLRLIVENGTTTDTTTLERGIQVFNGESAVSFSERGSVVVIQPEDALNLGTAMTLEAWIYPTAWGDQDAGGGRIIDKSFIRFFLNKTATGDFADSSLGLIIRHQDGTVGKIGTVRNSVVLNLWQHVAVTYAADNSEIHILVNGVDRTVIATEPSGPIVDNYIWAMYLGNNNTRSAGFQGRLDEIRVWDIARPLDALVPDMTEYLIGDETGLVGYWRMNEAGGDTLFDLTANHFSAVLENSDWGWGTDFVLPVALDPENQRPVTHLVLSSYPNPFNASTRIRFGLPQAADVSIQIYDIRGVQIQSIQLQMQDAGWHELAWNGHDLMGNTLDTGIYFCRIQTAEASQTIKMLMLK